MAARKANKKAKQSKSVAKKQSDHRPLELSLPPALADAVAIVAIVTAVFLLISMVSYAFYYQSASASLSVSELAQQNFMGKMGHFFATLLFSSFSWSALFFPVMLALFAYRIFQDEPLLLSFSRIVVKTAMFLMVLVLFSSLMTTVFANNLGGYLGEIFAGPFLKIFSKWGAILIQAAALVLFVGYLLNLSVLQLVKISYQSLKTAGAFLVFVLPRFSYEAFSRTAQFFSLSYDKVCELFGRTDNRHQTLSEKSRKVKINSSRRLEEELLEEDDSEYEYDDYEDDDEDYDYDEEPAEVIVRRSQPSINNKKLFKSHARKMAELYQDYTPPDFSLLTPAEEVDDQEDDIVLLHKSRLIEEKLKDFNISGKITEVHPGPVITMFEFEPAAGVKVGRIASLQDDLAMSLKANAIRIIAPIPNKGTVGIEVPNPHRDLVRLRQVFESPEFMETSSDLCIALGNDIYGQPVVVDIASMPHLLLAGATGAGKSVCINTILMSILFRCSPADLGLILIDPKILELSVYEGIPHLRAPVVTVPKKAKAVLEWAVKEMDRRYRMMQKYGVRSIDGYNDLVAGKSEETEIQNKVSNRSDEDDVINLTEDQLVAKGTIDFTDSSENQDDDLRITEELQKLPKLVIVVDEMADLMLSVGREIEDLIARLAQKARAAGIHLILATQRPSVDVITGLIKANFPARVSFRVSSRIDSRTILDSMGAERLLGKGDMLMMLPGAHHLQRVHGAFVSDAEVSKVIDKLKIGSKPQYDEEIIEYCEKVMESENDSSSGDVEYDELYDETIELILQKGQASTSMIQRAFRIGYNRAARIMETLEREGIIGPMDGAKPREILLKRDQQV